MLGHYLKEVFEKAVDAASGEVACIEFVILVFTLTVLWFMWLLRLKSRATADAEEAQATERSKLVKKVKGFLREDKSRIAAVTIILVALYFSYIPYEMYKEDQVQIGNLEQRKQVLQTDVDALDHAEYFDLWDPALRAFDKGDYEYSCIFFERFYTNQPHDDRYWTMMPLRSTAILRSDLAKHARSPEAVGRFEGSMRDLTNEISGAVNENLPVPYNNSGLLGNMVFNLRKSEDRLPPEETNFMNQVIETTEALRLKCAQREHTR